jgi:hypothetical protein
METGRFKKEIKIKRKIRIKIEDYPPPTLATSLVFSTNAAITASSPLRPDSRTLLNAANTRA